MKDKLYQVSKAHTVYKTADGKRVAGATTITGLLSKPYLIKWANNLGLEGVDCYKYRDEAAAIGTLAHAMVQAHLQGLKIDENNYSKNQIDLAYNCVLSYLEWEKSHKVKVLFCEKAFVSEKKKYGGTLDLYCELDGVPTLVDFKTGKAIYDEYFSQVSAYANLLKEHGYKVEQIKILRIGRDETEGFEERTLFNWDKYYKVFDNLNKIYKLKKELKWN